MDILIRTVGAFVAVFGFCCVLEVPKKLLIHTSIIGAIGWMVYLLMEAGGYSAVMASFWSAFVISVLSHISARILKSPVTVFLIGGILPMVPGAGMYRTAYSLIRESSDKVYQNLQETLLIAGGIALAIFITDTVFRMFIKREKTQ